MATPKRAMIPTAYKPTKWYSVLPQSGDGDFTFARASAATRVNEDGLIETINPNFIGNELVTNGDFATNSNWSANGWVISNRQASNSSSGTGHNLFQENVTSSGKTFKVVIKVTISAGSVVVMLGGGSGGYNAIGQATTSGTFTYYGVSNGTDNRILLQTGSGTTVGSVSIDNVSVKEITLNNIPRLDYTDGGCPNFLLEPQRTNLVNYSEDFENYFNVTEITLNSNYAISPDGTLNANKINFPSSSKSMYKSGLSLSGTHTVSFYVKGEGANIGKTFNVRLQGTSVNQNLNVTITGEWVRFEAQTDGLTTFELTNRNSATIGSGSLILFGFQIEQGSYPTSYIPTNGSAVTRNAEVCKGAGNAATFNDSEGVLMAEFSALADDGTFRVFGLSNGSTSNRILLYYSSTSNNIISLITGGGVVQSQLSVIVNDVKTFEKVAIKYKLNDVALWVNGFELKTDTSATMPSGLNELAFYGSGGDNFYGKTKQLQYYNSVLTDSELEKITSWTSFTDMANGQQYSII